METFPDGVPPSTPHEELTRVRGLFTFVEGSQTF
jgi:hypothetical protein